MTEVVNVVPQAVAAAMYRTVDECARQAKADGDPRPIGQIRAEVSAAMTLRPWDDSRPPVTAELRVLAPLNSLLPDPADPDAGGRPTGVAEVEGEPITAAHLRALLTALDAVSAPAACRPPPAARCTWICSAPAVACSPPSRAGNSNRRYAAAACSTPRGTVGVRSWTGHPRPRATRPPPPSAGGVAPVTTGAATPAAATGPAGRISTTSSRTPRAGPTDCDNLCCLCRRHHRLKTHSSGWSFHLDADGALLVTTPSGVTRISRPPGSYLLEPFELGAPLPDAVATTSRRLSHPVDHAVRSALVSVRSGRCGRGSAGPGRPGGSSTCSPRFPALTSTVAKPSAESSTTVGSASSGPAG